MNALVLVIAGLCIFAIGYRFYGTFLAAKVAVLDPRRIPPSIEFQDGRDYHPTNKWVLFGHHFAAISGAGPLIGPVLAAQFGFLPGALWILVGAVLAGAVHDYIILFASVRMQGKSLSKIAREHVSPLSGVVAGIAILFIIITALAGLGIAVVNALKDSSWGVFTIAASIPAALLVGLYMYKIRPGKIVEASIIGVTIVSLAVIFGGSIAHSSIGWMFNYSDKNLAIILPTYGFIASVLPVWVLLCPRDYLSSYMKIGVIGLLVLGIFILHPTLQMPAITKFIHGGGPIIPGKVWPFVMITIACGAISGFHALISSGTTPKMIKNEADIKPIGYGAMLVEGFVALMALIAACSLIPGDYFAINAPAAAFAKLGMHIHELPALTKMVGESNLVGRTGGAVSLAVGMAKIFSAIPGMNTLMAYWYHFAIMFEALFILTTVDTGTRVARFIVQELFSLKSYKEGLDEDEDMVKEKMPIIWVVVSSIFVCFSWGYLVYNGSVATIWPMFGVANQLLSMVALAIGTSVILNTSKAKYAWVTLVPMIFMFVTTLTAGIMSIQTIYFGSMLANPATHFNGILSGVMCIIMIILALIITFDCAWRWIPKYAMHREMQKSAKEVSGGEEEIVLTELHD